MIAAYIVGWLLLLVPLAALIWAVKWTVIDGRRRFSRRHQADINYLNRRRRR